MPSSGHIRSAIILGVLVVALLACGPGRGLVASGSESHGLSNGLLFSAWNEIQPSVSDGGEFLHLLIVLPGSEDSRSMTLTSWGGDAELMTFNVSFQPVSSNSGPVRPPPIEYELELVENTMVRTAGQEFDLLDGNLVLCLLSATGEAQVTQRSERVVERLGASELLNIFKEGLGPDHPARAASLNR